MSEGTEGAPGGLCTSTGLENWTSFSGVDIQPFDWRLCYSPRPGRARNNKAKRNHSDDEPENSGDRPYCRRTLSADMLPRKDGSRPGIELYDMLVFET
ncbi:hypothetical protein ACQKWADRAFT_310496 [Trichoderma austrokoningii]